MNGTIERHLRQLEAEGNLRRVPQQDVADDCLDFSLNDYLGIAGRLDLQQEFLESLDAGSRWLMGASASRLLATRQTPFSLLEHTLETTYGDGRRALLFNSGYHANTGIVSALAAADIAVIADKLVHASVIDGLKLGGAPFERFRHNDMAHLERLLHKAAEEGRVAMVIVESVYSMDGDRAPLEALIELKKKYKALLYVDEAEAGGWDVRCSMVPISTLRWVLSAKRWLRPERMHYAPKRCANGLSTKHAASFSRQRYHR